MKCTPSTLLKILENFPNNVFNFFFFFCFHRWCIIKLLYKWRHYSIYLLTKKSYRHQWSMSKLFFTLYNLNIGQAKLSIIWMIVVYRSLMLWAILLKFFFLHLLKFLFGFEQTFIVFEVKSKLWEKNINHQEGLKHLAMSKHMTTISKTFFWYKENSCYTS